MSSNLNDTTPAAPGGNVNVKWQTDGSGNDSAYVPVYALPGATSSTLGGVELNTDLGGTATAPTVVATHLTAPLPVAQGGSGLTYAPFDVPVFAPGLGSNNQKLLRIALARTVTFPASAANSYAVASVASTGAAVFTLSKNGVSFATVTYTASAVGVFVQASDANFVSGDLLEVDGPASADATLANVGITLFGERTA